MSFSLTPNVDATEKNDILREYFGAHKAVPNRNHISISFVNYICQLSFLYKKLICIKVGYCAIIDKKLILCLVIPTPGFSIFTIILSANLRSLLQGDVFVMIFNVFS